jgi:hypothetical protein
VPRGEYCSGRATPDRGLSFSQTGNLSRDGLPGRPTHSGVSTDGWKFSGDVVKFLQRGQRWRAYSLVCRINSEAHDRWCRIRWTARTRMLALK